MEEINTLASSSNDLQDDIIDENPNSLEFKTRKNKSMEITEFLKQKSHFFIMTEGGTPIYSRYGDMIHNCSIFATFSAIITKFTIFNTDKSFAEKLNYISNGKSLIVFLKKGKIMFIALSNKEDSISLLYSQLELLYSQLLSIITSERLPLLEEKPSSCMTAMQDTEQLFEQIIEYTSNTITSLISSYEVLPMENRAKLNEICANNIGTALICCIFSSSATELISLVKSNMIDLVQSDMILIQTLLMHSESIRNTESWIPLCLPGLSAEGFVQLYCNFTADKNIGIVFITESQENSLFLKFMEKSRQMIDEINDKGLMDNIKKSQEMKRNINNNSQEITSEIADDFINKLFNMDKADNKQLYYNKTISQSFTESNVNDSNKQSNDNNNNSNINSSNTLSRETTFSSTVYKAKDFKRDPLQKLKYAIFKHKILNQFFSVNFSHYSQITEQEKYIYKIYSKLYDMYNSQDSLTINVNNFYHIEKDDKYTHAIYVNENYILMGTFNFFKPLDEVCIILRDIFKIVRYYENNFFILIK